jgi:hypothetical protein
MVSFTAHTDGKVLVPDEPVEWEDGQRFHVTLEPVEEEQPAPDATANWVESARRLAALMPDDLPEDFAEQHDHYIHGTRRR